MRKLDNLVGFNVTKYLGSWVGKSISQREFVALITEQIKHFIEKTKCQAVFFSTHPMDNEINEIISDKVGGVYIPGGKFFSHDIMAAMSHIKLFCGMRFHSLVLAATAGAPIVGIKYAPKVGSLLKLLSSTDCLVEIDQLKSLADTLLMAYQNRVQLVNQQQKFVEQEKQNAQKAFEVVRTYIEENRPNILRS